MGYFVLIAPSSSIVAQADVIFEHRTYLPTVCAMSRWVSCWSGFHARSLAIAFGVLVPAMLLATISRNEDWHDEKTLWTDIATKSPNKARSWLGLAQFYRNDPVKGREYLIKGLEVDPGNEPLQTDFGILLLREHQPAEALVHFQRAMALTEETADRWNNIGAAYFEMKDMGASMSSFQSALSLDPCNFNARRNVMMLYSQGNDPQGVWKAGEVPAACVMIRERAEELEMLRRRAGKRTE